MSQATSGSETDDRGSPTNEADDDIPQEKTFECNICLDTAKDAVLSMCGHLFCWPCLHQWLEIRPTPQMCPVCKAAIGKDKVIPVYGRGGANKDPRDTLPPRPQGQRTEPENNTGQSYPGFGFGEGGFHMALSVGAFPFGLFTSTFNFGDTRPNLHGSVEPGPDATYSKFFLWIAILFIIWLWTL